MRMKGIREDKFYRTMFHLVVPIAIQNLISTAVSSADVVMVGFVGQDALSAVSLANQLQFILNLVYTGIASGATIMAAQYWGKKDTDAIEKIMGIAMQFTIVISTLFFIMALVFPKYVMLVFTNDPVLISYGAEYLKVLGFAYLFMSISQVYLCIMRSIERVTFAMMTFGSALVLNIILNAIFIFGLFGMPKMGIIGVALATVIARAIETTVCMIDAVRFETVRFRVSYIFKQHTVLFRDYLKYALPAFGNEVVWGVAFSMYSVIMGHLGNDMVAANSVVVVARNLGTVLCFGIANGGAIYLGKMMGEGKIEEAKQDSKKLLKVTFLSGLAGGLIIFLIRPLMMQMVNLTETATHYLTIMLLINIYYVIGQAMNTTWICAVFRSGGDSRFGFVCDFIDMWVFAVPIGFISAFLLKLPPMWVYFIICLDEFVKIPFVYRHYKSYRWLKNITRENI